MSLLSPAARGGHRCRVIATTLQVQSSLLGHGAYKLAHKMGGLVWGFGLHPLSQRSYYWSF